MKMNRRSAFLVDQARRYNSIDFIASDPISIPHRYDRKEDVEISGLAIEGCLKGMIIKNII